MSKRMFWPLFRSSWERSFTVTNITSAFAKPGIFPFAPGNVLTVINPKAITPKKNTAGLLSTPMTCRAVRRAERAYKADPTANKLQKIFHALERLSAQHSIDEHEKRGLAKALKLEKKKRQRGKRLNLLGEEDVGPQFFSPSRVRAAREFQCAKDAAEKQQKIDKAAKKAEAAVLRAQREAERKEKALQRSQQKQAALAEKERKRAEREAQKAQKEAEKAAEAARKAALRNSKQQKAVPMGKRVREEEEEVTPGKRRKTLPAEATGSRQERATGNLTTKSKPQATKKASKTCNSPINIVEGDTGGASASQGEKRGSRGRPLRAPQRFKI